MRLPATRVTSSPSVRERFRAFWVLPFQQKYVRVCYKLRRIWPSLPIPFHLSFGAWWLAERSALDFQLLANRFESSELQFVRALLRPGMTVLDIGAHHGLYTLLASKRVGSTGRVIAFEPSPRERKRLERHLRINHVQNVQVESYALGSKDEEAELFLVEGSNDWCNSLRPPATPDKTTKVPIRVRPLDDIVPKHFGRKVDFVKLDVEGAELEVLKGAHNTFSSHRPIVMAEVYEIRTEPWGYASREIVQLLAGMNYQWFLIENRGNLLPISDACETYDANLCAIPTERVKQTLELLNSRQVK